MSGANTVKLTKLNPLLGSGIKPSGSSLLNPSYLSGPGQQSSAPAPPVLSSYGGAPGVSAVKNPVAAAYAAASALSAKVGATAAPPAAMSLIPWSAGGEPSSFTSASNKRAGDDISSVADPQVRRKRRSRWGDDGQQKTVIPGMPTALPGNMDKDQEKAYVIQLQIEDYSRRLRSGLLEIPEDPSRR